MADNSISPARPGDNLAPVMGAGAAGRVESLQRAAQEPQVQARLALAPAVVLIGVGGWQILDQHPRWGGLATFGAAALLLFAAARARTSGDPVLRFTDSVADRAFDGVLLPSIALAMRQTDRAVAAVATVAIGVCFVAAYMRARGWALHFDVGDSLLVRAGRYLAVAAGLVTEGLLAALVATIVLTAWTAIDEARQVAAQGA
jgi:hypothetical protein